MRLDRALILSSMLVALSGIAALALTFEAALWLLVPAAALVLAGAVRPELLSRYALPERSLTPLVVAAFAFTIVDFFYIGGSLVIAGSDLMLILMCLKVLTLRENKDYVQLFAASFFLLLASTALSTEIYFVLPFAVFFITLTWALMLLTVKGEAESVRAGASRFRFGRGFFGGTALLTVGSFAVTLMIFFIIPRVGIGFFSKRAGGLLRTAGFSDSVELGSMGEIKLDPTVVMRVKMPGFGARPGFPLYWRGRTYDTYNGRSWSNPGKVWKPYYRTGGGNIYLGNRLPSQGAVEQEVALEPLDTATLFSLGHPLMIRSDFGMVRVGSAGELALPYPPGRRLHYTVFSAPRTESDAEDTPGGRYLQLPDDAGRIAEAAAAAVDGAQDEFGKARAIVGYLAANQRYTLDPPRNMKLSPIDDFLTGSKAGFCEHFATAMVLMLRSEGVNARLVSGFMGGQWNAYGGYFLVREQDAHTWVEAYIPGEGWMLFDPTPASAGGGGGQATELGPFTRVLDYVRFNWDRYVVYYNLRDQVAVVGVFADVYYDMKRALADAARSVSKPGGAAGLLSRLKSLSGAAATVAVIAVLLAAAVLLRALYRRKVPGQAIRVGFYGEMLKLMRKRGHVKKPTDTPMEFARKVPAGAGRLNESARVVTEAYYKVRYGGERLAPEEEEAVKGALEKIRTGGAQAGR